MATEKGKYSLCLRKMMEKIYQHPNIKIPVQGKWYLTEIKGSHGYMLQSSEHAL